MKISNPQKLRALTKHQDQKIMAALSLGFTRTHASVRGVRSAPSYTQPNRASKRRKGSENSAFGHIYADSVPAAVVAKRRAKNKVARKSRAQNRG